MNSTFQIVKTLFRAELVLRQDEHMVQDVSEFFHLELFRLDWEVVSKTCEDIVVFNSYKEMRVAFYQSYCSDQGRKYKGLWASAKSLLPMPRITHIMLSCQTDL